MARKLSAAVDEALTKILSGANPKAAEYEKRQKELNAEAVKPLPTALDLRRMKPARDFSPLEVMLTEMRARWECEDWAGACELARDAAPYVHSRFAAVTVSGDDAKPPVRVELFDAQALKKMVRGRVIEAEEEASATIEKLLEDKR